MFTFDKIIALIDYLFIYLNYIKFKNKLKNHFSAFEIYVFSYFILNIYFTYYLVLLLFIH